MTNATHHQLAELRARIEEHRAASLRVLRAIDRVCDTAITGSPSRTKGGAAWRDEEDPESLGHIETALGDSDSKSWCTDKRVARTLSDLDAKQRQEDLQRRPAERSARSSR